SKHDVSNQESIGSVNHHVNPLPCRSREIVQPEVVAGRRHKRKNQQRHKSENLERKTRDAAVSSVTEEQTNERGHVSESMKLDDRKHAMYQGDDEHGDPKMPPVIQKGQEPTIESA